MEGVRYDDPFLWDVDVVAESLCALDRPCTRDPVALAQTIKEEGVDGHILLTFEFVCSRQELFECLGIKLGAHKASLARAIISLRSRSLSYQRWKLDLTKELSEDVEASDVHSHPVASPQSPRDSVTADSGARDRLAKRKRLEPTHLTAKPVNLATLPLATEADHLLSREVTATKSQQEQEGLPWEHAAPQAYLGEGVMPISALTTSNHSLITQVLEDSDSFVTSFPVRLPAGLRLMASRVMKRYLVGRGRKEALWRQGLVAEESSASSDAGDEILELSDLPESLDEETLREIEAEKVTAEAAGALQSQKVVEPDRVHALLREAVDGFKEHWQVVRLPKYQRKAHKLWTDARKRGKKTHQVLQARQLAKDYDGRMHRIWTEIAEQTWAKESEVRLQASSLEQSVEDKEYNLWLAAMLDSRVEPPRPDCLPRPERRATRPPQSPNGSEVLTSSDEDDFIVQDQEPKDAMAVDRVPHISNSDGLASWDELTPTKTRHFPVIDLTQVETPPSLRRRRRDVNTIDLTVDPLKEREDMGEALGQRDQAGALTTSAEEFESVDKIGASPARHWSELKDRSRLLICLLWKLPHARRTAVFDAARDNSIDELFALAIEKHLRDPLQDASQLDHGGPQAMAFDMTRLFLTFIKVKDCGLNRVMTLTDSTKNKIVKAKGDTWCTFHGFLKRIESRFPQDSQIYRTDSFDDVEVDALAEDEDEAPPDSQGTPSKSRKNASKEVVQNKEAVDLREREKRRGEEQEARRLKLRATLNTLGMMPHDKSRLIINEAKQEDQPFIYVNEETGKRIKDHQVDGVRFLWNQIALDEEVRQGCLLAHTMGLGKTMQVITFLVAIQEAAKSADPAMVAQIPRDLRESKTLVLCPAGLVDNWMDELLIWAPRGIFGPIRKIEALLSPEERRQVVHTWKQEGGILITGYNMLRKVVEGDEETEESLVTGPNTVVADEAHILKNPDANVHQFCSRFKTNCRIALTGSPLANNVEEYYSMINWVAPNFLGPLGEFKEIYAHPIQQGLWGDSLGWEKRKALKMLQVLKETVAPKVHRRTIKSLKSELPPKHEFVICIPATAMQRKLYDLYVSSVGGERTGDPNGKRKLQQAQLFQVVSDLGLLCNHPRCFRQNMLDARQELRAGKSGWLHESVIASALKETNPALDLNDPGLSVKTELLSLILDEARAAGDKVLVFSQSIPTLDYLTNLLQMQKRRVSRLDGSTVIGKRQDMTKAFNAGNQEAYLISTNAGGIGLNIQGANRVVIFDFKWNPVNDQQAVGRAYRIGQEKAVFVYRFVVAGTFEEDLQNKAVFKMQLASRVVDKKNPLSWSKRLGSVLHPIKAVPAKSLAEFMGKDRVLDKLIGYKDKGEAIRYIVSADTFEEEDPDVDLTAEERRDAEDMVKLNRLRLTDPEEYERKRDEEQRRDLQERAGLPQQHGQRAWQQSQTTWGVPAPSQASLATRRPADGLDGPTSSPFATTDTPLMAARQQHMTTSLGGAQSIYAPLPPTPAPMAGANTYFGNEAPLGKASASEGPISETGPTTATATATSSTGAQIFSLPQRSQARESFEQKLCRRLETAETLGLPGASVSRQFTAKMLTMGIDRVRKQHQFGFLPDSQHWRLLEELLDHDGLVRAMVKGHVTDSFLALSSKKELEARVAVLNSVPVTELQAKWMARGGSSDHQNLVNLRRPSSQLGTRRKSALAREDLEVMREAADMRRRRSSFLPWQ